MQEEDKMQAAPDLQAKPTIRLQHRPQGKISYLLDGLPPCHVGTFLNLKPVFLFNIPEFLFTLSE